MQLSLECYKLSVHIRSVKLQRLKSQTRVAAIDCVDGFTGV